MSRAGPLIVAAFLLIANASDTLARGPPSTLRDLPQARVYLVTDSGRHRFKVWIAASDESRERGLMFVHEMSARRGMLFLFERPQFIAFWMKDTYLSLDLIFISDDCRVSDIAPNVRPQSLEPIVPSVPVVAVLELVAGSAAKIGLSPGHRLLLADSIGRAGHGAPCSQRRAVGQLPVLGRIPSEFTDLGIGDSRPCAKASDTPSEATRLL